MSFNIFEGEIFKKNKSREKQIEDKNENAKKTPAQLRTYGDRVIGLFCKDFSVKGYENIEEIREKYPNEKFIISAAHLNNLDVPAVLKVLGNDFNIQMTGESVLLEKMKYLGHRAMITIGGIENFTPLDYIEDKDGKHGEFNPENFNKLAEKINEGKTPWIANHPMSLDGKMKRSSIGPVYLAAKTKSMIIPTSLDISGGSVNLEGADEYLKTLTNRSRAVYHIGEVFKIPDIDVSIIEDVLARRKSGEVIDRLDLEKFSTVHAQLREQADLLGERIAALLPEEKRRSK